MDGARKRSVTRVLLVDDQEVQLDVWDLQLRELRVEVFRANTPRQALELARITRPEVAIVDMVLDCGNDRSGLDVIGALHDFDPDMYKHLASSWVGLKTTFIACKRGCNDVSSKPIDARAVVKLASGVQPDPEDEAYPTLDDAEWFHIERALHEFGGNIMHSAEALGLFPFSLRRKIHGYRVRAVVSRPDSDRKQRRFRRHPSKSQLG